MHMENSKRKNHWESVYETKALGETSWYQPVPETSLNFLHRFNIPITSKVIDIGGGDSLLVDHLLNMGFQHVTVLDISHSAIQRAKERLGEKAHLVTWVVSDILDIVPDIKYDVWHDRATFHFLTQVDEIQKYLNIAHSALTKDALMILGTFSENGPKKCSGIDIKQYSESSLVDLLSPLFTKMECLTVDHITPFNVVQNFVFCSFKNGS